MLLRTVLRLIRGTNLACASRPSMKGQEQAAWSQKEKMHTMKQASCVGLHWFLTCMKQPADACMKEVLMLAGVVEAHVTANKLFSFITI